MSFFFFFLKSQEASDLHKTKEDTFALRIKINQLSQVGECAGCAVMTPNQGGQSFQQQRLLNRKTSSSDALCCKQTQRCPSCTRSWTSWRTSTPTWKPIMKGETRVQFMFDRNQQRTSISIGVWVFHREKEDLKGMMMEYESYSSQIQTLQWVCPSADDVQCLRKSHFYLTFWPYLPHQGCQ